MALAAALASAQVNSEKARSLLARGMAKKPVVNIRAIICQRADYNSSVMQQVKVEMSRDGKIHQLVLAPISRQGLESVDDLHYVRSYSPDDRLLIVQPSLKQDPKDIAFQMNLVDRNYSVNIARRETIAGRPAVVVEATPKNKGLETRCYAIDEKTGFVLRLETCRPGKAPMLHFETKMVEYPSQIDGDCFKIDSKWTQTRTYDEREIVERGEKVPDLPFTPVLPQKLPLGFAIQEMEADNASSLPSLAVRLTDGLAKATVYQWPTKGVKRLPAPGGTLVRDAGAIRLLISGDVPDSVKKQLIEAFVNKLSKATDLSAESFMSWVSELQESLLALPLDRDLNINVMYIEVEPTSL
jgi:hypothetical protein